VKRTSYLSADFVAFVERLLREEEERARECG